ncbi:hypothetical protein RSW31_25435, partial [Escherichia coli]|nr:hypothetical protein [Escherichia coli]
HFKAGTGVHGMGKDRHGAAGKDIVLKVPMGTQILDEDEQEIHCNHEHPDAESPVERP